MIHQFKKGNLRFVIDVNSGAIHCVDAIVYQLLPYYQSENRSQLCERFRGDYSLDELNSAIDDIDQLVVRNVLFTPNQVLNSEKFLNRSFVIKALCLHIAHDCNLRCQYCFAAQGNFNGDNLMMSEAVAKRAIDFLVAHSGARKQLEVDLFGGEPTMNWSVCESVVAYGQDVAARHDKVIRFTLTTNGLLLTDERIDYINEHFHNVVLSIDGRPEVNDLMRPTASGKGSYDAILPKFKQLVAGRKGKSYYVRGTFTKQNLDFDRDVIHLADQGFRETSVEPVVSQPSDPYALTEADLPEVYAAYDRLADEMVARYNAPNDFNFFHFQVDLERGPCIIKRVSGCGAGTEYLAITPQGDIYPCHQFVGNEQFIMGNVMTGQLKEPALDFNNAHVEAKAACRECWAKYYCSGGCHANAYNFNGNIDEPYELGCKMERKRIENAIYIAAMKQLGATCDH